MGLGSRWLSIQIFVILCLGIGAQKDCSPSPSSVYISHSPMVICEYLPMDFLECSDPIDPRGDQAARTRLGYGCPRWGGNRYEEVLMTAVNCSVLPGVECFGDRIFKKDGFPCVRYTGHYFTSTLLYSILLGFLGVDRFCLGHTGTALLKMFSLGGFGIWWVTDVIRLVRGDLMPADGSNWMPYV
ncbi:TM2 domain-containing protein 2 [Galendromus occidentalis]|uniref:TM2 domain-containing protein 2 n=1 Tax=Galendromus occidentalis TaxID=34638 RepID=A0AAJ6VXS6_9ACAR|nr:TM2 domain-containing protein 2 [Galendromus occidentalis]